MYIAHDGRRRASPTPQVAILNANYVAKQLAALPGPLPGQGGLVAHECILDLRLEEAGGITVDDIAKRLMDYGFHAPTVSFPVPAR